MSPNSQQIDAIFEDSSSTSNSTWALDKDSEAIVYQKFFTEHIKISEENIGIPIAKNDQLPGDWFSFGVLILILYVAIMRLLARVDISDTFNGLLKIQSIDEVGFENKSKLLAFILLPLSVFVYAFYLSYIINPLYLHWHFDYLFLLFGLAIVVLFILKIVLEKSISLIFYTPKTFSLYLMDHLFVLGVSSMLQAPLLLLYVYSGVKIFLWIAFFVLGLFWLFRLFRGVSIGLMQTRFSRFYIFLYLCSLEIVPLLIVIKLIGK